MFKFIHCADIHLDSPLRGLERYEGAPLSAIRLATRAALENVVRLAVEEMVDLVLIAGDLFDGNWRDYNTGLFFASQMSRLREAGIRVVIVAGNHDAENKMTRSLRWPDNVRVLASARPETARFDDIGVAVHGQSFAQAAVSEDISRAYPQALPGMFNIGLLHTCADGSGGHAPYAPCSVDGLKSRNYDYWALGHVHKMSVLSSEPLIVFPGNIQGRHIKETGPKGCVVVSVDDSGRPAYRFEPVDVLRWAQAAVDADGAESPDAVLDLLNSPIASVLAEADGRPVALRVEFGGRTPADAELKRDIPRWTNETRARVTDAGAGQVWVEKVLFHTRMPGENEPAPALDGPLAEIRQLLAELRDEEQARQALMQELADLKAKLPQDVKGGEDGFSPESPAWSAGILDSVERLLAGRLGGGGGAG